MNIKMIVTDLDGTLLREDKTISVRTLAAIERCKAKGIKAVYATGRGSTSTALLPPQLFDGRVCCNGATAYAGDVRVYSRLIKIDSVRDLLIACDKAGFRVAAEYGGIHYSNFNVAETFPLLRQFKEVDFSKHNIDVEKIYAIIDSPEVVTLIGEYLSSDLYLQESRDGFAFVMHKEALKSSAVSSLAEYWGIDRNEIAAFGDDLNDIDLLEHSGVGIAMGNALCDVKDAADQICDTNENDGIAVWLEENLL